jgi:hypothetical protein
MSTNEEKLELLNTEKEENLVRINELEQFNTNLDNQIATNLSMNDMYEQQKITNNDQVTVLENANLVIDDMIADYS